MIHGIVASGSFPNAAPVITSDGGGSTASVSIFENDPFVTTVLATDADSDPITYSISGGADAARFDIDPVTGDLSFLYAPDFENPTDANSDNAYVVIVQASDGMASDTQTVTVTVLSVNEYVPVITSNGGGPTASISVPEGTTAVTTVTAIDIDSSPPLVYSISGGADAAAFAINSSTGVLTFVSPPAYSPAGDANSDNAYEVTVQVSDSVSTDSQAITVTVTDVVASALLTEDSNYVLTEDSNHILTEDS